MAQIDVEIDEYIDEIRTENLVKEIFRRKDAIKYLLERKEQLKGIRYIDELAIPVFKTPEEKLEYIKLVLGLKKWHTKENVIAEIQSL